MKIPRKPPDQDKALAALMNSREEFTRLIGSLAFRPLIGDRYIHWDSLRHRDLPKGVRSHEEWWAAIKLARTSLYRALPFSDTRGDPFRLAMPDPLQSAVSEIDRDLSGRVNIPEPLETPGTRDRYMMSALIEEAITSSQLEGASTTMPVAKEMLRSGRQPRDKNERMIFNNFQAMRHVREIASKPMTPRMIRELHRIVSADTLLDPSHAGSFRTGPVQVMMEGQVVHRPPPAGELQQRMKALCAFANQKTPAYYVHPVVRAILLHFMLAYDHPFIDGNGRTARALFYWSMLNARYWLCGYVSVSCILKKAPAQYASAYLYSETDDSDATYFVLYQTEVLRRAIQALHEHVKERVVAMRETQTLVRQAQHFNYRQLALLTHALGNPDAQYTVVSHATSHQVTRVTARKDLLEMARLGLLQTVRAGKRQIFLPVLELEDRLQEFGSKQKRKAPA